MSETGEVERLHELVTEMQVQLAFQEQTISELNSALTRQGEDIERLRREWSLVQERYASLNDQLPDTGTEPRPPHY
jgi:SlyX protein